MFYARTNEGRYASYGKGASIQEALNDVCEYYHRDFVVGEAEVDHLGDLIENWTFYPGTIIEFYDNPEYEGEPVKRVQFFVSSRYI